MVYAQEDLSSATASAPQQLRLLAGRSQLLKFDQSVERASVNNEAVADVVVVSPTQLLIHAKEVGSTTLIVWRGGSNELWTVQVEADVEDLRAMLRHVLPEEPINVQSTSGSVILSGTVSSQAVSQHASSLAESYAGKVVNLLKVEQGEFDALLRKLIPEDKITTFQTEDGIILSGTAMHPANVEKAVKAASLTAEKVVNLVDVLDQKQVLIEVRFAEANRSIAKSFGVDYAIQGPDFTKAGFLSGSLPPQTPSTPQFARIDPDDLLLSPSITDLLEFRNGTDISVALQALEGKGLIRILAEPNLLTMSGEQASFLAGGEFPIPVVQSAAAGGGNAVTIEFKEFGIRLNFKPQVASDDSIRMLIEPEVSVLDFGPAAVQIGGFQVPGLVTRKASTHVQLRSGESLVIGGLISQTDNRTNDQLPFLGNVPVLGQLFRSEQFKTEETELLVLVTPRLTKPSRLDVPARYEDMTAVGETLESQLSAPPYAEERADAIRNAIRKMNVHQTPAAAPSAAPAGPAAQKPAKAKTVAAQPVSPKFGSAPAKQPARRAAAATAPVERTNRESHAGFIHPARSGGL
jgi:pilus assembly protein CpaC